MDDDFDLFPKRENLDPFSFGKKEKSSEAEKEGDPDDLFGGQEHPQPGSLPDLPIDIPGDATAQPPEDPYPPDLSPGDPPATPSPPQDAASHFDEPSAAQDAAPDFRDGILADGPLSEGKTFDEPLPEKPDAYEEDEGKVKRSPSPFVVVAGALIIIIGLLYGALTYLKRDKPEAQPTLTPQATVPVAPPRSEQAPASESAGTEASAKEGAVADETGQAAAIDDGETTPAAEAAPEQPSAAVQVPQADEPLIETAGPTDEGAAPTAGAAPEDTAEESAPPPAATAGGAVYSVQVGAFILDSSVAELEKKLRGSGYEPILKKGSTTAMMNMLTVGPFANSGEGREALSRLRNAGVDSNLRTRNDGTAIINAGSYLLEENANDVMKKVRSLGYPVKMTRNEARLPMTFVRVGRFTGMEEADGMKAELQSEGLDGIVVKLQ